MIRKATKNDINRIVEIELFVSRYNFKNIISNEILYKKNTYEFTLDWITKSFDNLENDERIAEYYIIENEENIIIGWFSIVFSKKSRECSIWNIRIDVPFQYNNYGTLAMHFCFDLMKERGINKMILHTFEKNTIAIKFYEKMGFLFINREFSEELKINILNYEKLL